MTIKKIKSMADKIVVMSIADAEKMPGMLGKVIPVELRLNGYATRNDGTVKTFIEWSGK